MSAQPHRTSSLSAEYGTPRLWTDKARELMGGIDFDPASSLAFNLTIKATQICTIEDDALAQTIKWLGRLWVNPPYSRRHLASGLMPHVAFINKLLDQYWRGNVTQALLLVNAEPSKASSRRQRADGGRGDGDQHWFWPLWQFPICFSYYRIAFETIEPDGQRVAQRSPTHNNALVYLPPRPNLTDNLNNTAAALKRFVYLFEPLGNIVIPGRYWRLT
jgi:hypothetical protein